MTRSSYTVEGMTCGGCVRRVRDAVASLPGVLEVDVALREGLVSVVAGGELDAATVTSAIEAVGYEVAR